VRTKGNPIALLLVALLAGCASDSVLPVGELTADEDGAATYSTADAPRLAGGPFNPFAEQPTGPAPGRDVIENPTVAEVMLTGTLPEMAWGSADAPVTIIQYASLTCPHCRRFHEQTFPGLKRDYIDTGKVRYILREFPIGRTSGAATIALRCADPGKYLELYGKFLEQQPSWVSQEVRLDPIFGVAAQVGMTRQQFDACRENQSMIEGLKWVKERGRQLGVIGTPNFFVEGKLVKNVLTMDEIRAMVEPLIEARAAAKAGRRAD
jgi:protein-disulfide isomerase